MKDFIAALQIFLKYCPEDIHNPTQCEHDELIVVVNPANVSAEDLATLEKLSFRPDGDYFKSYRFGSC